MVGAQLVLRGHASRPGPTVADRFEIDGVLGSGGFGLVCSAINRGTGRTVALKLVLMPDASDGSPDLLREARALARIDHGSIVRVFSVGEGVLVTDHASAPVAFVEMELVRGESLRAYLERRPAAEHFLELMVRVARALHVAHKAGVVHRDLKPENIMVRADGTPVLIDFGLAVGAVLDDAMTSTTEQFQGSHDAIGARVTQTGFVRGTPGYIAPEAQVGVLGYSSDQYSIGMIIREGLTGRHPFTDAGENPRTPTGARGGPQWWPRVQPIAQRAAASARGERYPDVLRLAVALERLLTRTRRRRAVARAAATLGVVSVIVFDPTGLAPWTPAVRNVGQRLRGWISDSGEEAIQKFDTPSPEVRGPKAGAPGCNGLPRFAGTWNLAGDIAWSEYTSHYDNFPVRFQLDIEPRSGCDVMLTFTLLPDPDMKCAAAAGRTASVTSTAEVAPTGALVLRPRIELLGRNGATYRAPGRSNCETDALDHLGWVIELADGEDGTSTLSGAVEFADAKLRPTRRAKVIGRREPVSDAEASAHVPACVSACMLESLGGAAQRSCIAQQCVAPQSRFASAAVGPPSRDAVLPWLVTSQVNRVRAGKPLLGTTNSEFRCLSTTLARAGSWQVQLRGPDAQIERFDVELVQTDCTLQGSMWRSDDPRGRSQAFSVDGEVSSQGSWTLRGEGLRAPIVLVGGGEIGSAFGADADPTAWYARAHRRSSG